MNEFIKPSESNAGSPKSMAILIIARHILTRTCIFSILKREFPEFEFCEMATTGELGGASGRDVRLILLDIGDKPISDPFVEDQFTALGTFFPYVPVAVLSARDNEASAAMRRGVRGFFPPSIPIEVAMAGLRLVLAGGVYRPLSIDTRPNEPPCFDTISASHGVHEPLVIPDAVAVERDTTPCTMIDLTPREKHVLAALELGLPNKLIAARLNLSENTVKMHMRHIMQKCSARNRTEAVIFCSRRLSRADGYARARASSSS
jgi:DNA-binding NarL/FixJ family response regulator